MIFKPSPQFEQLDAKKRLCGLNERDCSNLAASVRIIR